jgi:hypothetical protein
MTYISNKPLPDYYVETTLANVTNGTDGTYTYAVDMTGKRVSGFHIELDGGSGTVTVTIEGRIGTLTTFVDITNQVFSVANTQSDAIWVDNAGVLSVFTRIQIKVIASTSGANDADWLIEHKYLY